MTSSTLEQSLLQDDVFGPLSNTSCKLVCWVLVFHLNKLLLFVSPASKISRIPCKRLDRAEEAQVFFLSGHFLCTYDDGSKVFFYISHHLCFTNVVTILCIIKNINMKFSNTQNFGHTLCIIQYIGAYTTQLLLSQGH